MQDAEKAARLHERTSELRPAGAPPSTESLLGREMRCAIWEAEPCRVAPFDEVIPSWTAHTPPGTLIEIQIRVGDVARDTSAKYATGTDEPAGSTTKNGRCADDALPADAECSTDTGTSADNRGPADAGTSTAIGTSADTVTVAQTEHATGNAHKPRARHETRVETDTQTSVVEGAARTSGWAIVGRWSSGIDYSGECGGTPDWHSHTVADQRVHGLRVDADTVSLDTEVMGDSATLFQVRALLYAPPGPPLPEIERVSVLTRTAPRTSAAELSVSRPTGQDIDLTLPAFSQHLAGAVPGHADGNSWCSPTSLAMLMEAAREHRAETAVALPLAAHEAAPQIAATMRRVWDYSYGGAGNWAFNVAWAAAQGFDAFVDELPGLRAAEELLAAGEPFAASLTFGTEELPEAGYETAGHLLVVSGVTADGDVRVHDPAAPDNSRVRRVYPRAAFERAWLSLRGSGGIVYRVRCGDRQR